MSKPYFLQDIEKLGATFAETFEVPPLKDREGLRTGDFAKLIFEGKPKGSGVPERMWVKVFKALKDGWYEGVLDNDPLYVTCVKIGDEVLFKPKHICDIITKEWGR